VNYTKGEWKVITRGGSMRVVAISGKPEIADIIGNFEPNAHLIAAAPDMYEVLQDVEMTMGMTLADHFPELRNKIVKAIAKAEGKE
jgi:hypothetical protein